MLWGDFSCLCQLFEVEALENTPSVTVVVAHVRDVEHDTERVHYGWH